MRNEEHTIRSRFLTHTRRVGFEKRPEALRAHTTPGLKKLVAALVAPIAMSGLIALAALQMGSTAPGSQDFAQAASQIGPWEGPQTPPGELSYLPPELNGRDSLVAKTAHRNISTHLRPVSALCGVHALINVATPPHPGQHLPVCCCLPVLEILPLCSETMW